VGDTIAPRTKATGQDRSIATWATTAIETMVATTSPMASSEICPAFLRSSRIEEKNAAAYRSGGRKIRRTTSGCSSIDGTPGRNPIPTPPTTRRIG
jgi:hypothetical protein